MIKMYIGLHVKCPLSGQILIKIELSRQFFGKYSNITFMKTLPLETESFHADGRTDMSKLIVAFRILRTRLNN